MTETPKPPRGSRFLSILQEELTARLGRVAEVSRMAAGCTLVVAIGMIYEIPMIPYMAYVVFLISKTEATSTLLTGIIAILAFTLAIILTFLLFLIDASEPALRLPIMAVSTFIGMYLSRTLTLGPLAFLTAYVLVMSQTLIDRAPNLEFLTRGVLWLWLIAVIPVVITVLINLLFGDNPARMAKQSAIELLRSLAAKILDSQQKLPSSRQTDILNLTILRDRANLLNKNLKKHSVIDTELIASLAELITMQNLLPSETPLVTRQNLSLQLSASATALEQEQAPLTNDSPPEQTGQHDQIANEHPVIIAMQTCTARLCRGLAGRYEAGGAPPPPSHSKKALFVADAFQNPEYVQYALKATLSIMASYIAYSAVDWPEISTAITTCFFVSLASVGETMHKLTLRLSGALIGGILAALCIVFVLPNLTDIGQLSIVIASVSALCAWLATSSERLSYAGMQIVFAFFLGVLQGYGPGTELTQLRDRVIGILLGNLIISLVYTSLWPNSATDRIRTSLAAAYRSVGQILSEVTENRSKATINAIKALAESQRLLKLKDFELDLTKEQNPIGPDTLNALERLTAAALVIANLPDNLPETSKTQIRKQDQELTNWFNNSADQLLAEGHLSPAPGPWAAMNKTPTDTAQPALQSAMKARAQLQQEIEHAIAASF